MTEYLVHWYDKWHIAHPGAIHDDTEECQNCDGVGNISGIICKMCSGTRRTKSKERTIRLAWFERDGALICFDYSEPPVRALPEEL